MPLTYQGPVLGFLVFFSRSTYFFSRNLGFFLEKLISFVFLITVFNNFENRRSLILMLKFDKINNKERGYRKINNKVNVSIITFSN